MKVLYPDLNVVRVDGACAANVAREAAEAAGIRLEVIPKEPGRKTFEVLPRRRGSRTHPCVGDEAPAPACRPEDTVISSRAWILLAMTSLVARRLRPA
ncbi:MAG TPA: hypothetical protein VFR81_07745 [Longimicrobium sp.]|nr:hypothetical protein [Longimicrobium sp.]